MASIRGRLETAAATHRRAAALVAAAGERLAGGVPTRHLAAGEHSLRELTERLRVAAALLAPGWLGGNLAALPAGTPLGGAGRPALVRLGTAYPLDDAGFPVVLPLGHLAFDADSSDPRVAGVLRALLLRLLASTRAGALLVRVVDGAGNRADGRAGSRADGRADGRADDRGDGRGDDRGGAFGAFAPLHDAGIMPPPVTDRCGLLAVLAEAEQWVRARGCAGRRTLLVVIGSWPQDTEPADRSRLTALAGAGPGAGLHLLVAGWPPPLAGAANGRPLPLTTQVALHHPYVVVGHPPDGSFASPVPPGGSPSAGLNAPTYLDESPPPELISKVCAELAGQASDRARLTLGELLPDDLIWTDAATDGLAVVLGRGNGGAPVRLRLCDSTPHWLMVGRPGSGRTALLLDVLYGLTSRYGPEQFAAYLLDFSGGRSFGQFVPQPSDPSYLPHARAVTVEPHRADGLAVLRRLARQLDRRAPGHTRLPRLVCLIDELGELLAGDDPTATEAAQLLAALAQRGGPLGIHLVLASRDLPPAPVATQCRVRIALPGGAPALDAANQAAVGLALGTAVVNTASGLGGPRGATRAHEQQVRFPDPYADRVALAGLRHRLWRAGADSAGGGGAREPA
jgi:hypothetical protein